jgi:transcriptional regulator with XRE-family HTH domain
MSRRARVSPAQAGLPDGGARRRTPGLRREEVAVLAGVGASWYQWLEQGRDISVSPQVLDAVARVLRLSNAERRHLYLLAGLNPPAPEVAPEVRDMCDGLRRLIDTWMPYPAHIMDPYYNCVMYNDAAGMVLGMRPENTQNCIIDFFTDPLYRGQSRTWEKNAYWINSAPPRRSSPRCGRSGTSRTLGRSARSSTIRSSGCSPSSPPR